VRDRDAYLRLTAVLVLMFMATGASAPLLSVYVRSLGADTGQIGLVFATFQGATLLSQYAWGRQSDKLGRRKPLLLFGTAGMAVSFAAMAAAPWFGFLFVIRILEGLSMAAYQSGSLAMVGDLLEHETDRGRLMGTYRMFGSLAFSVAALFGGWLADSVGLRAAVLLSALCFGAAFLLVLRVRERAAERQAPVVTPSPVAPPPVAPSLPPWALWPFLGLTVAWFLGMGSVVTLWPVYMSGVGYAQTAISGLWALAALGEVPCLYLAGIMADRWGRKWVLIGGVVGMACVYIAYTLSTSFAWIVAVQVFRSLAYSCFETPSLTYTTELGLRERRGRLAGLFYTANGTGGIAGSALGGALAQGYGLVLMFRISAGIMFVAALVAAFVMPRRKRPIADS
jgi:MFS family permease